MTDRERVAVAELYRATRERVTALVSDLDLAALETPVPACPGWSVRDVVAHLAANAAGELTTPPTEEETAAQMARWSGRGIAEILAVWREAAPKYEETLGASTTVAPLIDIVSHEHDIRAGLCRPGARSSAAVHHCAEWLLASLRTPVPLRVVVEDAQFQTDRTEGGELVLTTSRFEALRWRMGRRSRAQLAAMDWSADPAPVIDYLAVFGPAITDISE